MAAMLFYLAMARHTENDSYLVKRCIAEDLAAWSDLIKRYSNLITISIENRLKKYGFDLPRQDIEDIRQDMLGSIWRDKKLEGVKNREDISYWLAIVSGNAAMEYVRKRLSCKPKTVSIFDKLDEKELAEFIPSKALNPNDEASKNELSKKIDASLAALPSKERLIIKLNFFHGKKYEEISDILNLPAGTVSSYVKRAKEKLRESLKDFR